MPDLMIAPPETGGSAPFPRKRWTVAECAKLVSEGLLDGAKYELIEGDVVSKMGQGRLHIIVVTRLLAVLGAVFGMDRVQTQAAIGIGEGQEISDPEPDVAVLRQNVREYATRSPDPATDVLLAVEAAATSLRGDTTVKKTLYAQAGVPEYWVIDIDGRLVTVYRNPDKLAADYRETLIFMDAERLSPLAAPTTSILVADLLP